MVNDLDGVRPDDLRREAEGVERECRALRRTYRHLPPDEVTRLFATTLEIESKVNRGIPNSTRFPGWRRSNTLAVARGSLIRARYQLSPPWYYFASKAGAVVAGFAVVALTLLCYTRFLPYAYDWAHETGRNGFIVLVAAIGTPIWLFGPIMLGWWVLKRVTTGLWYYGSLWCPDDQLL